jgi:hypothetical protein
MAVFHLMFLLSLHSTGNCPFGETPLPNGPRHCGQLLSESDELPKANMRLDNANRAPKPKRDFFIL